MRFPAEANRHSHRWFAKRRPVALCHKAGSPDGVLLRRVPGTLTSSFNDYRAIDQTILQVRKHLGTKVGVPVLALAGGPMVENEQRNLVSDVQSLIIPNCGHFPTEEQPEVLLAALLDFFTA